jgi:hypothetical protein
VHFAAGRGCGSDLGASWRSSGRRAGRSGHGSGRSTPRNSPTGVKHTLSTNDHSRRLVPSTKPQSSMETEQRHTYSPEIWSQQREHGTILVFSPLSTLSQQLVFIHPAHGPGANVKSPMATRVLHTRFAPSSPAMAHSRPWQPATARHQPLFAAPKPHLSDTTCVHLFSGTFWMQCLSVPFFAIHCAVHLSGGLRK